ncbi:MAG: hemerythrin domain-containing protein [Candidatus Dependentiae bacterium]
MKKLLAIFFVIPILLNFKILFSIEQKDVNVIKKEEFEIPLTEDLMREHGILNRLLLIYEECIRRIDCKSDFPIQSLEKAIQIIESFIENYHEKLEEDYIFPLFEKKKKKVQLVRTLKDQHVKGRIITSQLKKIVTNKKDLNTKEKHAAKRLMQKFISMYRPHEAREDTVLFPLIRSLISPKEFKELSEKFEELEHKLFGDNGFKSILNKVADIEKQFGIYKLEQFTPNTK